MVFGNSWFELEHIASGTNIRFNAFDALKQWRAEELPPVKVPRSCGVGREESKPGWRQMLRACRATSARSIGTPDVPLHVDGASAPELRTGFLSGVAFSLVQEAEPGSDPGLRLHLHNLLHRLPQVLHSENFKASPQRVLMPLHQQESTDFMHGSQGLPVLVEHAEQHVKGRT